MLAQLLDRRLHALVEPRRQLHVGRDALKRLFPGQDQSLDPGLIVFLLPRTFSICFARYSRVPRFVARLRSELARRDVITIALDLLLRVGQVPLRGFEAARRQSSTLAASACAISARASFENAALDRNQLGVAQQDFGFGCALLRIRWSPLSFSAMAWRKRSAAFAQCSGARLGASAASVSSRVLINRPERFALFAAVIARCKAASPSCTRARTLSGLRPLRASFGRRLLSLHGRGERTGGERIDLFVHGLVDGGLQRRRIRCLCADCAGNQQQDRIGRRSSDSGIPFSAYARIRAAAARATHDVFVTGQLLDPDRAAGVELVRRDADLGAHAELGAVGELRRGVVEHDRAVDAGQESLGRGWFSPRWIRCVRSRRSRCEPSPHPRRRRFSRR